MSTKFIVIRHGFSVSNLEKRFTGSYDVELDETGVLQAERCAAALKDERIDKIYTSDLKRAYNTAMPIAVSHSLEPIKDKLLREIFAGEWEGIPFSELEEKYAEDYFVWKNDKGRAVCTGGESVAEMSRRVLAELDRIARENDGKTVCVATHATPIRALCTFALGKRVEDMQSVDWVSNASISIFEYENGIFTPIEINRTSHLGELVTALPQNA